MAACSTPDVAISPRVLIAEDQPEVIEAIRLVLKQEGEGWAIASLHNTLVAGPKV